MGRRHDESRDRERDAATEDDVTDDEEESAAEIDEETLFETPAPLGSKEYIDLELARINPPA